MHATSWPSAFACQIRSASASHSPRCKRRSNTTLVSSRTRINYTSSAALPARSHGIRRLRAEAGLHSISQAATEVVSLTVAPLPSNLKHRATPEFLSQEITESRRAKQARDPRLRRSPWLAIGSLNVNPVRGKNPANSSRIIGERWPVFHPVVHLGIACPTNSILSLTSLFGQPKMPDYLTLDANRSR
jgi:hypothetical protein